MLVVPYYIAALMIASTAALSAALGMVGQEILTRHRNRRKRDCKGISCDACKHRGPWSEMVNKEPCIRCITEGLGAGYERGGKSR
jgi:hypothetical protein